MLPLSLPALAAAGAALSIILAAGTRKVCDAKKLPRCRQQLLAPTCIPGECLKVATAHFNTHSVLITNQGKQFESPHVDLHQIQVLSLALLSRTRFSNQKLLCATFEAMPSNRCQNVLQFSLTINYDRLQQQVLLRCCCNYAKIIDDFINLNIGYELPTICPDPGWGSSLGK